MLPFDVNFDELTNNQEWELKVTNNQATFSSDSINYIIKKGQVLDVSYIRINPKDSLFLENQSYLITILSK